jgi:phage tail sheath protein FI
VPTYTTPGVYYERVDASAPAIVAIRTDITGFVGISERGPLDTAVPVESWRQFQAYFGGFSGVGYLAYVVRAFFENGGKRCWVVRVASNDSNGGALPAAVIVGSPGPGRDVWRLAASSPGVWGADLSVLLKETHQAQTVTRSDGSTPTKTAVSSTTGFTRATLVRLSQPPAPPVMKVVSDVDPVAGCLIWVNDQPALRLSYDAPLTGFDPTWPVLVESVEYTLVVEQAGIPIALYEGLSLIPEHPDYGPLRLGPVVIPTDVEARRILPPLPQSIVIEELRPEFASGAAGASSRALEVLQVPPGPAPLTGGGDGLALLTTYDFIGEPFDPLDSDEVKRAKTRGLQVLDAIDEVAVLAVPDIHIQPITPPPTAPLPPCVPDPCLPIAPLPAAPSAPTAAIELPPVFSDAEIYRVQAAMVQQCEDRRDCIALLDPPIDASRDDALGLGAARVWRNKFDSTYAAFYYPWLRVVDPLRSAAAITRDIPPSGHVAGQYAQNDFDVGVHKAPANAPLAWAQDVTVPLDDAQHGVLNPLGINALRAFPGRGLRVMGARTVSSDPAFRYVNVRRLLMMIEKAIYLSTQWAVFEPNDAITRAKLRLSLTSFMVSLWQRGALAGATADQAFFVRCDEGNNPPPDRENGRLLAEVGVAPSYPFEFVILRVGRTDDEFEIVEQPTRRGGI